LLKPRLRPESRKNERRRIVLEDFKIFEEKGWARHLSCRNKANKTIIWLSREPGTDKRNGPSTARDAKISQSDPDEKDILQRREKKKNKQN